jgi:predicted ATPase/class 3 adenylate cyclase
VIAVGTRDKEKREQPLNLIQMHGHEIAAAPEADRASPLTISLFGPFEVRLHGQPLPRLRTRKGQWLLALLALRHGHEMDRAWLAGTLWPDSSEAAAYASLRSSLKDLRRALGSEAGRLCSPTPRTLRLDLDAADTDVGVFDAAIAQGDEAGLERAVSLYRGPLLEECAEEWAFHERQAREQACLTALETLSAGALSRGDPATAEHHLRRAVALDSLRETAQRGLMQALAAGGNYAAATQVYRELRLRLHRELNAAPDPETQALYQQLREEAQGKAAHGSRLTVHDSEPAHREPCTVSREPPFPTGTVTFLFTDIEGSSQLWERHPQAMREALAQHDLLLRQSLQTHGGLIFKTVGDAFYAAFATASAAVAAALAAQRALLTEEWGRYFRRGSEAGYPPERSEGRVPGGGPLRVRMALHTGVAETREGDYFGPSLNRVARLLDAGHGGQVLLSMPTEELVRDELPEGTSLRPLGEHRLKDLVRSEQVFQLLHPELPASFPPLRSLAAFTHNLPLQWTSFIGREKELEEVKRLLPTTPLLTLSGAGGCGKTRLALQAAADLLGAYPDGVWLVELAALAEPLLVPQAAATALGVPEQPGRPLTATLIEHLRSRSLLLLLDNCEHLLAACAELVEALLRACANVRLLATSRERLGLTGERVYLVPSLSLPELPPPSARNGASKLGEEWVTAALRSEAVRLFADRAVYNQPEFALTAQNAAEVARLCHRLDGIPLAIELAAARVKALPVETINERLDDMFGLLTGGSRTALPRQQTLRALIDWSYNLLAEPERALLRRLSVFAGGWPLEAAETICSGEGIEQWEVLDLLTGLVEKSLVVYEAREGEPRYRLLETIRQHARERLLEAGEAEAVRQRHLLFYLALAERAEPELRRSDQRVWLDRLEAEHDNLRAALRWCQEAETAARMALALAEFWDARGYRIEGWEAFRQILEQGGAIPLDVRARATGWAGLLGLRIGEYGPARALLQESLALHRSLGDQAGRTRALQLLGSLERQHGHLQTARTYLEESLEIRRKGGDRLAIAGSLNDLGLVRRDLGDYSEARAYLEECLAVCREAGNKRRIAMALGNLGRLAVNQGDDTAARPLLEESLARYREVGDEGGVALNLFNLSGIAHRQRDYSRAEALSEESVALWRKVGERPGLAGTLIGWGRAMLAQEEAARAEGLVRESLQILRGIEDLRCTRDALALQAQVVARQGQSARAARLWGAVEALYMATGAPPPRDQTEGMDVVRADLGEEAFAAALAEGRAMTLQQAVTYALEESDADGPTQ